MMIPRPPLLRLNQAIDVPDTEEGRRTDPRSGEEVEPGYVAANADGERIPRNFCHGEPRVNVRNPSSNLTAAVLHQNILEPAPKHPKAIVPIVQ